MSWSSTSKRLHPKAQGCPALRATLGTDRIVDILPQRGYISLSPFPHFHDLSSPCPNRSRKSYLHIVLSTKNRTLFLADPLVREEVHNYLGGTCNNLDCPVLRVGGVADHVHILCRLSRTISIADLVKELKRESSQWIKSKFPDLADFYWQLGYGAFSVSESKVEEVREYVANQERHHATMTFQDEYRLLLKKHGLTWDERYVWD